MRIATLALLLIFDTLLQEYTALHRVPFNPVDKYTIAIVADNRTGRAFRVMKGAPQARRVCLFYDLYVGLTAPMRALHNNDVRALV